MQLRGPADPKKPAPQLGCEDGSGCKQTKHFSKAWPSDPTDARDVLSVMGKGQSSWKRQQMVTSRLEAFYPPNAEEASRLRDPPLKINRVGCDQ
jgi:hypothetical protein